MCILYENFRFKIIFMLHSITNQKIIAHIWKLTIKYFNHEVSTGHFYSLKHNLSLFVIKQCDILCHYESHKGEFIRPSSISTCNELIHIQAKRSWGR